MLCDRRRFALAPRQKGDAAILPARPKDLAQLEHLTADRLRPAGEDARRKIVARAVHDAHVAAPVVGIANHGNVRLSHMLDGKPVAESRGRLAVRFTIAARRRLDDARRAVGEEFFRRMVLGRIDAQHQSPGLRKRRPVQGGRGRSA